MHIRFFGDSYDIVKQSLIHWLDDFGKWSVHPMFTEIVPSSEAQAFVRFLDSTLLSSEVITKDTDRKKYFECVNGVGNLFLDPDTGIKTDKAGRKPEYIYGHELVRIVKARPNDLTMVFDMSLARGSEHKGAERKLEYFHHQGIFGFTYVTHTSFIFLGTDTKLVDEASKVIVKKSKLPNKRFVRQRID